MLRTWRCRNDRASATTRIAAPSRTTSSRSRVLSGDRAWHSAARKLVKSCRPTSTCAAACIAAASSGRITCQARPTSRVSGARRLTIR